MRIIFLGTNGWYSTELGNTVSILIGTEEYYIILDAGDAIHKIDQYIKEEKPIIILLSHLHLDHIIGLHTFAKFPFKQDINIYGYKGTKKGIKKIIKHPYSSPFSDIPINVQIHDLDEGKYNIGFPITCKLLFHADPCLGYKIEIEDKIIAYCTDTGVCQNLYQLSNNADLLITECSYKSGQEEWAWPHLKPEEAAEVAVKSNVKKLILTHFDASSYRTIQDRERAEETAKKIFANTTAASDGLELILK
ncbi:MAG: ribonuclease Z [Promethearchaeota archaeon]|nr:MAG: ribonuclease Z [Candidatus Lokiarchaeota archaeon]